MSAGTDLSIQHRVTIEEALAAAARLGASTLPGAPSDYLVPLGDMGARIALAVAWRGLVARGIDTDPALSEAIGLAAGHDLLVIVTVTADGSVERHWYAARGGRMVRIAVDDVAGELTLTTLDSAGLADRLLATVPHDEGGAVTSVLIQSVYRAAGSVAGGEVGWSAPPIDPNLREQLLDILPGGG